MSNLSFLALSSKSKDEVNQWWNLNKNYRFNEWTIPDFVTSESRDFIVKLINEYKVLWNIGGK